MQAAGASVSNTTQVADTADDDARAKTIHMKLTIPFQQLASCMPNADVNVAVKLTTEKKGFDIFDITARHVAPNRSYTVFGGPVTPFDGDGEAGALVFNSANADPLPLP